VPDDPEVNLSLKAFLQIEHCPEEWRRLDLYLIRDEEVIFYVGQSYVAFHRLGTFLRRFQRPFPGRKVHCLQLASIYVLPGRANELEECQVCLPGVRQVPVRTIPDPAAHSLPEQRYEPAAGTHSCKILFAVHIP
jgi:hypothetical protein